MRNHLRSFIKIVEQGSYSKAARLLFLSQPALTQQIRALESDLGFELFDHRKKGTLTLTPAGERFYQHACQIEESYQRAVEECRGLSESGVTELKIGVDFRDANLLPSELFSRFSSLCPGVRVIFEQDIWERLTERLTAGNLSACFCNEPTRIPDEFRYDFVTSVPCGVVMSKKHRLAKKSRLFPEDLAGCAICLPADEIGKTSQEMRTYLEKAVPHIQILDEPHSAITFPLVENTAKLFLTMLSAKDHFPGLCCLPVELDLTISMGFLRPAHCPEELLTFIRVAREFYQDTVNGKPVFS